MPALKLLQPIVALLLGGLAAVLMGFSPAVQAESAAPYSITVWARGVFGTDGQAGEMVLVDEASYPVAFREQVLARLAKARIPAPRLGDMPASLRTGVWVDFLITPAQGDQASTVKLQGLGLAPLPVERYLASTPDDVAASGGWSGGVTATCQVGVDGRCAEVEVRALPGMPESLRRFAKASFERWRFEPQQLNGQPVPGEYTTVFSLHTIDAVPDDFRGDKFDRLQRGR